MRWMKYSLGLTLFPIGTQAAVVNSGDDIKDVTTIEPGVAMVHARYDTGASGYQTVSGSGFFVAPNIFVTVAHNYYQKNKETGGGSLRSTNGQYFVTLGSNSAKRSMNPTSGLTQNLSIKDVYPYNLPEFAKSYQNDLAVVVTKKPVSEQDVRQVSQRSVVKGEHISMIGYPNDFSSALLSVKNKVRLVDGKQYRVDGHIQSIDSNGHVLYHMSALGGFSGAPLFNNDGEVIGVHQHGSNGDGIPEAEQVGGGLVFTAAHKEFIQKMIDKYAIRGWFEDDGVRYYYDENHQLIKNGKKEIDGVMYDFDKNGRASIVSGEARGRYFIKIVNTTGKTLIEKRLIGEGKVGDLFEYQPTTDKWILAFLKTNSKVKPLTLEGSPYEEVSYVSKYSIGDMVLTLVVDGDLSEEVLREDKPKVDKPDSEEVGGIHSRTDMPIVHLPDDVFKPKVEIPKLEVPKVEDPKVETPKLEVPKVEEPEVKTPTARKPKVEEPEVETPTVRKPKAEQPKAEQPKVEQPKVEQPKAEGPKVEQPKVEQPKAEEPKIEQPKAEEPKIEQPKVEQPTVEQPKVEQPKVEQPKVEQPNVEQPKADGPKVEQPKVEHPKVDEPKVVEPKSELLNILSIRRVEKPRSYLLVRVWSNLSVRFWKK